jgi:hypothetical protein
MLDTFRDRRRAYMFTVNPRGVQRDAVLTEGQGEDATFDTLWKSKGYLTPAGYAVWMAIPFKSLRFPDNADGVWGVGLSRIIPRTTEEVFWPVVTRRIAEIVPQLASVHGFEHLSTNQHLQLIPYGAFTGATYIDRAALQNHSAREARAGLDAKVVLKDRVTADLTLHPDFSHVETDDPQVTINQRYEVYFPEKRPFFLENAGTFQTPDTLFFSRRIVNPQWGSRVTGKAGGWNLAGLVAQDRLPDDGRSLAAGIGVVRVQREIGRESALGALVTGRDTQGSRNFVASTDVRLRMGQHWTFQGQAARSIQDDVRTAKGTSTLAELTRTDRHLSLVTRYLARSPEFLPLLGFVARTDLRQLSDAVSYRWRPRSGRLLAFGPGLGTSVTWDYAGHPLDREVSPHFGLEFGAATQVLLTGFDNTETFAGKTFRIRTAQLHLSSAWLRWMQLSGFLQRGTRINYAPANGIAPFLGRTTDAFCNITLRPAAPIAFEQSYILTRLDAAESLGGPRETGVIFSNRLARSKLNLQLTRELSLRAILDYGTIASNPSLSSIESQTHLRGDLLATYQLNPWTALYVGYTEGLEDLDMETGQRLNVRPRGSFYRTDRQLFTKASGVIRF